MKDVMFDLETLGLKAGSVILSLGAVVFDPRSDALGASVYYHIELKDSLDRGFTIDPNTFYWWLAQDDFARQSLINGRAFASPLGDALHSFSRWLPAGAVMWGWGDMDIDQLKHAYDTVKLERPWHYRNVRDARSIVLEAVEDEQMVRVSPTIAHDALCDAIAQAKTIQKLYRFRPTLGL